MPELTLKEQKQLSSYSMVVASDKQKYIALNLSNHNSMKEYYEIAKVLGDDK